VCFPGAAYNSRVTPQSASLAPSSLRVEANGATHHVLEWPTSEPRGTALLLHGLMDAAANWDLVAPALCDAGRRVVAPDLRGFGDGARVASGGYYHFPDYVFDVVDLVDALVPAPSPLFVVGHSMGGTVATLYAGTRPARVTSLVLVEGVGPPDNDPDVTPDRFRGWVDTVRGIRARGERAMASRDEALRRLRVNHPRVDPETLDTRLEALVRVLDDGRVTWKADPLHATRSPMPFFVRTYEAFARRVTCPVLFVSGGPLGWHPADEDARLAMFPRLRRAEIDDAGHMMHWSRPAELARLIAEFTREGEPT
jgi:pimeloyl-ACP methyl ester carboxylesterase